MIKKLLLLLLPFYVVQATKEGTVLTSSYDDEGHLIELHSSDGSISYSYHYDSSSNLTRALDNITQLSTERSYDTQGNLLSEKLASGLVLKKTYDAEGNAASLHLPDGSFVTYIYEDAYLRAICRYNKHGELLYTHTYAAYDSSGNLLSQELIGNLGTLHFSFDVEGRRNKLSSPFFSQEVIFHDNLEKISQIIESNNLRELFYDENGQLIKETGAFPHTYTYDSQENLVQKDNDLLLPDGETTYSYDPLNRLIKVEKKEGTLIFSYDAYSRRISKKSITPTSQESMFFIYDGLHEIGCTDSAGTILELRILSPQALSETEMGIAFELYGITYAPLYDLFGNVVKIIPMDDHQEIESFAYSAFGEEAPSLSKNPWRFSSKRFDLDSELYDFGARFYQPFLGRWLTPDPLGPVDSLNLHVYLRNDPYSYIDLYGLSSQSRTSFLKSCWKSLTSKTPSTTYDLGIEEDSHIFFVNGINNSFQDAQSSALFLSTMTPGLNVHGTYSASQGFFKDCLKYFQNFRHTHSSPTKVLKDQIYQHLRDHPSQPILIVCHSNGAVITRNTLANLDPELRKYIHVVAIAPGAFIPEHLCQSVHHYESENDFVPMLDPKGRKKAKNNITTLKKHPEAPLFDHTFTSPTYKKALELKISEHLKK